MVRLDRGGLAGLGAGRFDDVGVDGALGQPLGAFLLAGLVLEHFHEFTADDLALGFGIGHAGQLAHELGGRVDVDDLDAHVLGEGLHDLFAFVQAQQAVVDENAGELVADGLVDQAAATEESTPPDRPRMTSSSPTCSRMRATASAT